MSTDSWCCLWSATTCQLDMIRLPIVAIRKKLMISKAGFKFPVNWKAGAMQTFHPTPLPLLAISLCFPCAAIQVQQGESWLVSARNASGTQELFQFASLSLERTKIHFFRFLKNWKLWNHLFLNHFAWFLRDLWFVLFTLKGILFCTLSLCWGIFDCLIFNNYSSSPNGLLTQSPWGREE